MTHREDNQLLDAAQARIEDNESTSLAIRLAAAYVAGGLTVFACVLVMNLKVPM